MTAVYTSEQVAKHNLKTDLWVTIHSKVYDITTYIEDHPGGVPSLIEVAGQDATEAFEELGHSQHAKDVLEKYLVGKLDHNEEIQPPKIVRKLAAEPAATSTALFDTAVVIAVAEMLSIGAVVVLGFLIARRLGKSLTARHSGLVLKLFQIALPWLSSTSLASVLIQQYIKRAAPTAVPVKRPMHFKVDKIAIPPKPQANRTALVSGEYIDLPVSSVETLSKDSNKITLKLPKSNSILGLPTGQHISIRSMINGKEVSRQYTPISSNKDLGRLELLIKNYDDGLLTGQYLKRVQPGDSMSISGPKGQMHYRRGLASSINMIAGGTGITPMYQIIRAICEDPRDNTRVVLIYGNQTESDILLRAELDDLVAKHSDQLEIHHMLSKPDSSWSGRVGRCTQELCKELFESGADKQVKAMLCGPPGMIENAKEWLVHLGYDRANAVSKMRDQVFVF